MGIPGGSPHQYDAGLTSEQIEAIATARLKAANEAAKARMNSTRAVTAEGPPVPAPGQHGHVMGPEPSPRRGPSSNTGGAPSAKMPKANYLASYAEVPKIRSTSRQRSPQSSPQSSPRGSLTGNASSSSVSACKPLGYAGYDDGHRQGRSKERSTSRGAQKPSQSRKRRDSSDSANTDEMQELL